MTCSARTTVGPVTVDVSGFISAITPGTWPDWFAAIGTTAAFAIAAIAYARDVKARNWAQARLVYCKVLGVTAYEAMKSFPLLDQGAQVGHGDVKLGHVEAVDGTVLHFSESPFVLVTIAVHNGSDELIGPVWVQGFNPGDGAPWNFRVPLGFVEPRSHGVVELYCSNPAHPGEPNVLGRVVFRDSGGRWWRRSGWEPVEPRSTPTPKLVGHGWVD